MQPNHLEVFCLGSPFRQASPSIHIHSAYPPGLRAIIPPPCTAPRKEQPLRPLSSLEVAGTAVRKRKVRGLTRDSSVPAPSPYPATRLLPCLWSGSPAPGVMISPSREFASLPFLVIGRDSRVDQGLSAPLIGGRRARGRLRCPSGKEGRKEGSEGNIWPPPPGPVCAAAAAVRAPALRAPGSPPLSLPLRRPGLPRGCHGELLRPRGGAASFPPSPPTCPVPLARPPRWVVPPSRPPALAASGAGSERDAGRGSTGGAQSGAGGGGGRRRRRNRGERGWDLGAAPECESLPTRTAGGGWAEVAPRW